ncbi:exosome non-catalytic core subunit rrp4 [Allomyces arbusculus]|nr:exosome non-catalytic core subunit rrp4 [Allomyces arbusculus]
MDVQIHLPSHVRAADNRDDETMIDANVHLVTPGETITNDPQFMKGHGAYNDGDHTLVSSLGGVVDQINKLITVRPLRTRYSGAVGDVVVGRIVEVGQKRWAVDVNARQHAQLMLSAINLPGGVQRRKSESDELAMRTFFAEGDMLVAEAQSVPTDRSIALHTRSTKYGKLRNGCLVTVPPALIVRCKSHFHSLPCGVDVILGLNGYIWVAAHVAAPPAIDEADARVTAEALYSNQNDEIDVATRLNIARVANCIRALASHDLPVSDTMIMYAYEASLAFDQPAELLTASNARDVATQAQLMVQQSME